MAGLFPEAVKWSFWLVQKKLPQALAAGEFQEEVVVPETPKAPEFVAAPTAPVEEPVVAHKSQSLLQRQLPLLKNQSQCHKPQSLSQRQLLPAEEPVAAPVQELVPQAAPANGPAFQQAPQQAYHNNLLKQLINKFLPRSTRTTLSCPTKSIWCSVGSY